MTTHDDDPGPFTITATSDGWKVEGMTAREGRLVGAVLQVVANQLRPHLAPTAGEDSPFTLTRSEQGAAQVTGLTTRERHLMTLFLGLTQETQLRHLKLGQDAFAQVRTEAAAEARLIATEVLREYLPQIIEQAQQTAAEEARAALAHVKTTTVKDVERDSAGDIVRVRERQIIQ